MQQMTAQIAAQAAPAGQPNLAELMAQFRRDEQDARLPKSLDALIQEIPERVTFELTPTLLQSTAWRVIRRFHEILGQLSRADRQTLIKELGPFIDQMQGASSIQDYPAGLHSRFQLLAAPAAPAAASDDTSASKGKGKGKGKGKTVDSNACITCGLPGHWAREWWKCPEQNPDVPYTTPSPANRKRAAPGPSRPAIEDGEE